MLESRRKKYAAATIQRALGEFIAAQKIRRHRLAAAILISEAVGNFSAKLARLRLRRDTAAAYAIQSVYRGYRSRVEIGARQAEKNEAVIKVQRLFRAQHQPERRAFIEERARKRNEAMISEKHIRNTQNSTRKTPRLVTSLHAITPAVLSGEVPGGRVTYLPRVEGKAGEIISQTGGAPSTHVSRPSSGCGDDIGDERNDVDDVGEDCGLPLALLSQHKTRVAEASLEPPREIHTTAAAVSAAAEAAEGRASSAKSSSKTVRMQIDGSVTAATGGHRAGISKARKTALEEVDQNARGRIGADRRHCLERKALQSAVEAVASGMARHGAITPDHARDLKGVLALGEDDPALKVSLRQQLSGLEQHLSALQAATVRTRPDEGGDKVAVTALRRRLPDVQTAAVRSKAGGSSGRQGEGCEETDTMARRGRGDEHALRRALVALEGRLSRPLA